MSCNGCRVLRKGCSESCNLRSSLKWIDCADAQAHATVFVAKFFGRAGLMSFINNVSDNERPALFQSLLYEACGRTVNPVYGAVGLLCSGNWHICEAAVDSVLRGGTLTPVVSVPGTMPFGSFDPRLEQDHNEEDRSTMPAQKRKLNEDQKVVDHSSVQKKICVSKHEQEEQRMMRFLPARVPSSPATYRSSDTIELDLSLNLCYPTSPTKARLKDAKMSSPASVSVTSEGSMTSLDTVDPTTSDTILISPHPKEELRLLDLLW